MKLFRKKNKRSIEEQNKANQEYWGKNDIVNEDLEAGQEELLETMRNWGISDEDMIKYFGIADEGKNISKDGKVYWVCNHCHHAVRFTSREDYILHHYREHA